MHPDDSERISSYRPLAELVPAGWQTGFIETADGARTHYARTGGGKPPVLLLHGIQAMGLMWLRTARDLAGDYDLIMPDFRGHGRSSRIDQPLGPETLIDDMQALIGALGLGRPAVVGHSLGADIAGRMAARGAARAAALIDPALRNFAALMPPGMADPPPWMAGIINAMERIRAAPHEERLRAGLALLPPGARPWLEDDYVSFVEAHGLFDTRFYQSAAAMGYLFESPETIRRIECPILLMTAAPPMPGAAVDAGLASFTDNWREGTHVHVADSGHFIPFDQFERFSDTLRAFLARHG